MFLSQEIDIKLCQICTKIHIYAILYESCSIKQIIIHKYKSNLKTTITNRNLRISGLLILYFLKFLFWTFNRYIDNKLHIVRIVHIVTRTSANGSAV